MQSLNWSICGLVGVTALAAEASAGERLLMPYACHIERNRLDVRPAPLGAFEIIGRREQQPFTTCSPGGDRCTTLMVHRFSIACDGERVPWLRVAAAAGADRGGRRWIERGRLNIVRPVDGDTAGDAAAARSCSEAGGRVATDRDCLPWTPRPAMERIALPAGFAPLGDLGARVELDGAPTAAGESVAATADLPGADTSQDQPQTAIPQAPRTDTGGTQVATEPRPAAVPQRLVLPLSKQPPEWVTVVEAKELPADAALGPVAGPTLWAWLAGLAAVALMAVGLARIPPDKRAGGLAAVQRTLADLRRALADRIAAARAPLARNPDFSSGDEPLSEPDPALANAAWTAATLLDQIEQAVQGLGAATPLRGVLEEELESIHQRLVVTRAASLDAGASAKAAGQFRALIRELERVQRIANSAAASLSVVRPQLAVPQNKSEAYLLLGVNADASESILKKLVDALRMTWHPDHARDEQDRLLREDRIKQINVAWELISDKRQAA
ncbi:MAG: DnaJ domain-containing protein [Hyphomicrobium sp.]